MIYAIGTKYLNNERNSIKEVQEILRKNLSVAMICFVFWDMGKIVFYYILLGYQMVYFGIKIIINVEVKTLAHKV